MMTTLTQMCKDTGVDPYPPDDATPAAAVVNAPMSTLTHVHGVNSWKLSPVQQGGGRVECPTFYTRDISATTAGSGRELFRVTLFADRPEQLLLPGESMPATAEAA